MPRRVLRALPVIAAFAAATAATTIVARSERSPVPATLPHTHQTSWPPLSTARTFFLEELQDKLDGNWDAAWRTLYPTHRLVASKTEFVSCERARPFPAPLRSLRIASIRKTLVRVPGSTRPIPGVALHVHIQLNWYGPRDPITFNHTFHLVPVSGHWTWLLSPSRYHLYAGDACLQQLAL